MLTVYRLITPFEQQRTLEWTTKLWQSLANAAILLAFVIVMTVTAVLLYKYRCYQVGEL